MRTTWTVVSGMRRSGSALCYEIVRAILGNEYGMGWITWQQFDDLARTNDGKCEHVIVKSHVHLPSHSPSAWRINADGRMRIVHSYRDVRDVAASLIKFVEDPDDTILEQSLLATMAESDAWRQMKIKCAYRYEDMMDNPARKIGQIADFLGREVDAQEMAERFSMENNRSLLPSEHRTPDRVWWHNHIDDGRVGKWEDVLTPPQLEMVNRIGSDWLKKMGYSA